tara:strand:- start:3779 stop:4594 length:816 start_codon:yes stop_codon:yes gene_type:complete
MNKTILYIYISFLIIIIIFCISNPIVDNKTYAKIFDHEENIDLNNIKKFQTLETKILNERINANEKLENYRHGMIIDRLKFLKPFVSINKIKGPKGDKGEPGETSRGSGSGDGESSAGNATATATATAYGERGPPGPQGPPGNPLFNLYEDEYIDTSDKVTLMNLRLPIDTEKFTDEKAYLLLCNAFIISEKRSKTVIYNGVFIITFMGNKYSIVSQIDRNEPTINSDESEFNVTIIPHPNYPDYPPVVKIMRLREEDDTYLFLNLNLKEI